MTVGQIWERDKPLLSHAKLSPLCNGYLRWAMTDRGRERTRNLEPSDRMGVFSPSGWNLWPLTVSACVFIVSIYVTEGSLRALCLLAFVIFHRLYTRGDCKSS